MQALLLGAGLALIAAYSGPKDRQLIAPSVRTGELDLSMPRPEGPAQIVAHLRRSAKLMRIYPALRASAGPATNCQSFGPKACWRLKPSQDDLGLRAVVAAGESGKVSFEC